MTKQPPKKRAKRVSVAPISTAAAVPNETTQVESSSSESSDSDFEEDDAFDRFDQKEINASPDHTALKYDLRPGKIVTKGTISYWKEARVTA